MFSDLPILLDETSLEKDEKIEMLFYLVESQSTKGRSNVNLALNTQDRRNVVFITSEQHLDPTKLGIFRRCVFLNINENINIEKLLFLTKNNIVGAGYDYLNFFLANSEEFLENLYKYNNSIFEPARALLFTLSILEKYYEVEFVKLREKINEIIAEHEKRVDYFEFCKNALQSIYFSHKQNFFDPELNFRLCPTKDGVIKRIPEIPKVFWGFRDQKNILYFFPKFLTQELRFNHIDLQSFLDVMRKKGVLITNERKGYYKTKLPEELGMSNTLVRFYAFNLNVLNLDSGEQEQIEQDKQQNEIIQKTQIQSYQKMKIKEVVVESLDFLNLSRNDYEILTEKLKDYLQKIQEMRQKISIDDLEMYFKKEFETEKDFSKSWILEMALDFIQLLKERITKNEIPKEEVQINTIYDAIVELTTYEDDEIY